jgi:hypothetical protein
VRSCCGRAAYFDDYEHEIRANLKATTQDGTEASRNTAPVTANFARATKPLPAWVRIGLAVAPPVAQDGSRSRVSRSDRKRLGFSLSSGKK